MGLFFRFWAPTGSKLGSLSKLDIFFVVCFGQGLLDLIDDVEIVPDLDHRSGKSEPFAPARSFKLCQVYANTV